MNRAENAVADDNQHKDGQKAGYTSQSKTDNVKNSNSNAGFCTASHLLEGVSKPNYTNLLPKESPSKHLPINLLKDEKSDSKVIENVDSDQLFDGCIFSPFSDTQISKIDGIKGSSLVTTNDAKVASPLPSISTHSSTNPAVTADLTDDAACKTTVETEILSKATEISEDILLNQVKEQNVDKNTNNGNHKQIAELPDTSNPKEFKAIEGSKPDQKLCEREAAGSTNYDHKATSCDSTSTKGTIEITEEMLSLSSWDLPEIVLEKYSSSGINNLFRWQAECLLTGKVLEGGKLCFHTFLIFNNATN